MKYQGRFPREGIWVSGSSHANQPHQPLARAHTHTHTQTLTHSFTHARTHTHTCDPSQQDYDEASKQ